MSSVDVVGGVLEFGDVERVEAGANGLAAFLLYSLPAVHQVRLHVRVCIQCMHTTSCHSTGNREPHRGCHLKPRTSTTYRIYPIITRWAGKCSPILRHSPADPGLNLLHASLGPPVAPESISQTELRSVQPCWHSSRLCPSDRYTQTHRPRYTCSNRPHLRTLCLPCGLDSTILNLDLTVLLTYSCNVNCPFSPENLDPDWTMSSTSRILVFLARIAYALLDVVNCYRRCSTVRLSVCLCVDHDREPCTNG